MDNNQPEKRPQRRKSEIVSVRFTPAELDALRVLTAGKPLSTFLRETALASLGNRCQDCGASAARLVGYQNGVVKFGPPHLLSFTSSGSSPTPQFLWLCQDDCMKRFGVWAA